MVRLAILTALLAIVTAPSVAAQNTRNIDTRRIAPIYVRADGMEWQGQLLRLGPDSLTILEQGTSREIRLTDVTRIEARGDSVRNGAIVGAIILGSWCALVCPQGLDGYSNGQLPYILGVNVALGAAVGAGIDGMHVGRTTIYQPLEAAAEGRRNGVSAFLSKRFRF